MINNKEDHESPSWSTQKHMNHEARLAKIEAQIPHLATKADLESLKTQIADKINSQTRWIVGVVIVPLLVALIAALFK